MDKYIHQENLALYQRRLTEPCTDAQRKVILELLAAEEANEPPPIKRIAKQR